MNPSVAIALRYIRPRRLSAIGLIGGISVVGIAVGTAALIIVLSLFNGFRGVAIDSMTRAGPHVRVVGNAASIVSGINGVALASHVYQSTLVVQLPGRTTAARTLGVSNTPAVVDDLARSTVIGVADIAQRQGLSGAVVSLELAEALNVYLGDTLVVLAPEAIESSLLTMSIPTGARVEVRGILTPATSGASASVQMYMLDSVLTSIARASAVAYTDIRLVDADRADIVAQTLRERGYQAEPWREMHRTMFDMMRLERIGSFIVLSLILKAIGATDRQIHQIFQLQGLAFGVGSVLVGSVLGVGLCIGQRTFQWIRFDITQGYAIPALPVDVYALDVIIVACMGILCAGLAAQYPARRAARIVVADAVRSR